eukprot:10507811-Heterocapsa_arctica.AAC.1
MDSGAKRAYRYAKAGTPDPIAGVRDKEGKRHCAPTKIAQVFAEGWKEIWNEPWEDPGDGFGPTNTTGSHQAYQGHHREEAAGGSTRG